MSVNEPKEMNHYFSSFNHFTQNDNHNWINTPKPNQTLETMQFNMLQVLCATNYSRIIHVTNANH